MKINVLNRMLVAAVIFAVSIVGMSLPTSANQKPEHAQKQQKKQKKGQAQQAQKQATEQEKDQPRAEQVKKAQPRAAQAKQAQPQASQVKQDQLRATQARQNQLQAAQVKQDQLRAAQVRQDQQLRAQKVKRDQVRAARLNQDQLRAQQVSQDRPPGWDKGKKVGWGNSDVPPGKQARLSEQRRQQLIAEQQQRLAQYRLYADQRQRLADQRTAQLQQQKRLAQYRYQQQYFERMRQQQMRLVSEQHDYNNDPYYYTAPSYRYLRGGSYYETNQFGADQLKQALNNGYEQGFRAGQADQQDRWNGNYQESYAYQDANYGYGGYYVTQADYNHYFREGFRRGYEDGYNTRSQYGSQSNGSYSMLGTILSQILNLQSLR